MDYLPLSYINQYAYCPRRFWYMYAQSEMEVNAHVLRGIQNHERAHTPGYESQNDGVRVHRRVYVYSQRWQITGYCDLLEEHPDGRFVPVEYKQGRKGKWANDQAQLCAQALCLEEMTGRPVPEGALFYGQRKRRTGVVFDDALRRRVEAVAEAVHALFGDAVTPPPPTTAPCAGCSLHPACRPDAFRGKKTSVADWVAARLEENTGREDVW